MMEYWLEGRKFSVNYQELKSAYHIFKDMSDEEFLNNLPDAAHLACVILFLKEIQAEAFISDIGILHELIHLICDPENGTNTPLSYIRENFNTILYLA